MIDSQRCLELFTYYLTLSPHLPHIFFPAIFPRWHTLNMLYYIVLFTLLSFILVFTCGTQSNFTLIPDITAALAHYGGFNESTIDLSQRGTNLFDVGQYQPYPNPRQPWPIWRRKNGQQVRVVQYCYDNAATREALDCAVKNSILRWSNKLSFGPFQD